MGKKRGAQGAKGRSHRMTLAAAATVCAWVVLAQSAWAKAPLVEKVTVAGTSDTTVAR
jgi:hypothetical protein